MQPPDISEAFVEASLQSVSVNVLMYALGIVIKLAWSHFSLMEEKSISSDHGFHETLENKLERLLENEFERVKLAAAVILHAIGKGNEQVSCFLVIPVGYKNHTTTNHKKFCCVMHKFIIQCVHLTLPCSHIVWQNSTPVLS